MYILTAVLRRRNEACGITGFKELRKKPWVTCANYWQCVLYRKGPPYDNNLKERFHSFLCMFTCFFLFLLSAFSRFILTIFGLSAFLPSAFYYLHFSISTFPSVSAIRRYPALVCRHLVWFWCFTLSIPVLLSRGCQKLTTTLHF